MNRFARRLAALTLLCVSLAFPAFAGLTVVGRVAVASAGTRQQLYSSASIPNVKGAVSVLIQARNVNVGTVYIGDVTLVKGTGVGVAAELLPGQSVTFPVPASTIDPHLLYVDADNSGDGVNVMLIY